MFYVLSVISGKPGPLYETENWEKTINTAFKVVKKSDPLYTSLIPDEEILNELEADACWSSNQGDIWVYILQSEKFEEQ